MARQLATGPIADSDISTCLLTSDDFSLEIEVLAACAGVGWEVRHGATYEDPVTGIPRQFDIRAMTIEGHLGMRLAIECKSLKPNFPLVVSQLPRTANERQHDVLASYRPLSDLTNAKTWRVRPALSMYKQGSYVGKSLTQVGKSANTPEWVTGDGEVYNKWAQALASCKDLIADAALAYAKNSVKAWTIILPVLVVRDGTLWAVNYDLNGNASPPKQLDEVNFYVGKDYTVQAAYPNLRPVSINYMLSHLHIFTLKGFRNFINSVGKTWDWKHIIPIDNQTSEVAGEPL